MSAMGAEPAGLAGLERVDGERPAVDAPTRRGAQVFVVVAQVPHHIVDLGAAVAPMMGNTGDPAQRVSGLRAGRIDLTDDGVLGAVDRGEGGHGSANTRMAMFGPRGRQLVRR
ncbi:hypothetical protein BN977_00163 [Mycolicibacterium cosmeticum]|uniref:Uncharacterized protein n=1 Tax=Mycolicibacterium cosmeticum TaxID=258533 RepID=W9BG25_MYCCO|nr:hypothetical protein BN977_00163 [Mycolicibacterium cosmeticum]